MPGKVVVLRDDLREYMMDYHHRTDGDVCRADGQSWPCSIYKRLKEALDNPALDGYRPF